MLHGIKALIVDDDEISRGMLSEILKKRGILCTQAADGREAMYLLEVNEGIDIVLLDLQMPVMDGYEVLSQCKRKPYLSDIPIIVMTSNLQEKIKSLKLGADDFLGKPYNMEELELRIQKLIQFYRLIQGAARAKDEFIAIASHELRTPMHQIIGLAELLSDMHLSNEDQELLNMLKDATVDLNDIILSILNYAQIEHVAESALKAPFSLRYALKELIAAHAQAAKEKGVELKIDVADDVSDALSGSLYYIKKVFDILLDNAVKFSFGGDVTISICEEPIGKSSSRFCCIVCDKGLGIPGELTKKIFEPFVQVESYLKRRNSGIGLGLSIAKRIVEHLGGIISVTSELGKGSSFSFSFPCELQVGE
jgi:signal transduction histidine kinase